jgi:hypothetical protein
LRFVEVDEEVERRRRLRERDLFFLSFFPPEISLPSFLKMPVSESSVAFESLRRSVFVALCSSRKPPDDDEPPMALLSDLVSSLTVDLATCEAAVLAASSISRLFSRSLYSWSFSFFWYNWFHKLPEPAPPPPLSPPPPAPEPRSRPPRSFLLRVSPPMVKPTVYCICVGRQSSGKLLGSARGAKGGSVSRVGSRLDSVIAATKLKLLKHLWRNLKDGKSGRDDDETQLRCAVLPFKPYEFICEAVRRWQTASVSEVLQACTTAL